MFFWPALLTLVRLVAHKAVDADGMVVGDVAMLAEAIIRKTCRELGIEVIDIAVNPDHVHLIIK